MDRAQKQTIMQALIAAKEAAGCIIAAEDEFDLRPANMMNRLPALAAEEASEVKRLGLLETQLAQWRKPRRCAKTPVARVMTQCLSWHRWTKMSSMS